MRSNLSLNLVSFLGASFLSVSLLGTPSVSLAALPKTSALNCYIEEPRYNQEVEYDINSGASDISLYARVKASSSIDPLNLAPMASVTLIAPRTKSELIATIEGTGIRYIFKMAGKVLLNVRKESSGYAIGFPSPISNYHIDASESDSPIVHFECNIEPVL